MKLFAIQYGWSRDRMSDFVISKGEEMIYLTDKRVNWVQCNPDAMKPAIGDVDWIMELDGEEIDHVALFEEFKIDEPQWEDPDNWYR